MTPPAPRSTSAVAESAAPLPAEWLRPGLSPRQLVTILLAYRVWIVVVTALVVVATGVVSKLLPKTYESTVTLLIEPPGIDPETGRDFPVALAQSHLATQFDFLQSPAVLLPVVERLGWAADPERTRGYRGQAGQGGLNDFLAAELRKRLRFSMGRDSRFVQVTAQARSPEAAARMANTVAEVFIQGQRARSESPTQARAQRHGEQLEALRLELERAQSALDGYRQQHGLLDLDRGLDLETERLRDLQLRLAQAEAEQRAAAARQRQLGSDADFAQLESRLIQELKLQLAAQEARAAELATRLGRNHPQRRAVEDEIRLLRERLEREQAQYRGAIAAQAQASADNVAALRRAVREQENRVFTLRGHLDEAARLRREVDTARALYESALRSYETVLFGARLVQTPASVVSPATPALKPSKPVVRVNVALAVFVGGFLGVATALLRELLNRRIRCREDLERDLGLPVLAELDATAAPIGPSRVRPRLAR